MKTFHKIIAYSLATLLIFSVTFQYALKKVYAVDTLQIPMTEEFIESWLFPIFSINNEWTFGQSGVRLHDAIEQSAGSDNIEFTSDYNNAYSFAYNINNIVDPFDLSNADEFYTAYFANDINYKRFVMQKDISELKDFMTSEEQYDLANALIDENVALGLGYQTKEAAFLNSVVNIVNIGGQKIAIAFDKSGQWLGSSFKNIISQVEQLTTDAISNLKGQIKTTNPYPNITNGFVLRTVSLCSGTQSTSRYYPKQYRIIYNSRPDLFFYTPWNNPYNVENNFSERDLYIVFCSDLGTPTLASGQLILGNNNVIQLSSISYEASSTFELNGYNWQVGRILLHFTLDFSSKTQGYFYGAEYGKLSSLDNIKQYISEYFPAAETIPSIPPYTVDIVDTSGVPYTVPDIGDKASTITDVFPVIDTLRDTILTIPEDINTIKELVDTLPASIAEEIADIIDDVIADAITLPDVLVEEDTDDPDPPNPDPDNPLPEYPPELPSWFWPTLFPDIFDFKGLEIFKPIFDIVGTNYSMYNVWVMIPAIIIFVVIIYFIISVL